MKLILLLAACLLTACKTTPSGVQRVIVPIWEMDRP